MFPSAYGTQLYNIKNIFHQKLICSAGMARYAPNVQEIILKI